MKRYWLGYSALSGVIVAALCFVSASLAARAQNQNPAPTDPSPLPWAFPSPAPGLEREKDDGSVKHIPGSTLAFNQVQIDSAFDPPDWYPNEHPPAPETVTHGRKPDLRACAQCHLPNGRGNPESASLAGQPAVYVTQQMADYRSGARKDSRIMTLLAEKATDAEAKAAADYYAGLKMRQWLKVVETDTAPKSYVSSTYMRYPLKEGGTEPLGHRIIELPENPALTAANDAHAMFVAYVPAGSIKRGKELATTGGSKTIRCSICHGPNLTGLGGAPGLAGRSSIFVVRQLYDIQHGSRAGIWADLMKESVAKLTVDDMIDIAAYTASLAP